MSDDTTGWHRTSATAAQGASFADRHRGQLEETISRLVAAGALDEGTPRVLDGLIDAWLDAELAGLASEQADQTAALRRDVGLAEAQLARRAAEVDAARARLEAAEGSLAAAVAAYRAGTGVKPGLRAAA